MPFYYLCSTLKDVTVLNFYVLMCANNTLFINQGKFNDVRLAQLELSYLAKLTCLLVTSAISERDSIEAHESCHAEADIKLN